MAKLDRTFHALADPTRRAVLTRLTEGPGSVGDLARPFAMALPTFLAHLRVLEEGVVGGDDAQPLPVEVRLHPRRVPPDGAGVGTGRRSRLKLLRRRPFHVCAGVASSYGVDRHTVQSGE